MAIAHDHQDISHAGMSRSEKNRCAATFVLTWVGFFAAIGAFAWLMSSF